MKQITETSFQQGYFKIPRTLLKQQTGSGQLENMGAFFQVLSHANYSETTYNIHGLTIFCQRGESLISNLHWSILFGWTRYKTARFLSIRIRHLRSVRKPRGRLYLSNAMIIINPF